MKYFFTLVSVILLLLTANASTEVPFSKGVNFSMWFQADSPQEINFTKYTKQDFIDVKSLGCDAIRLPINLHFMTDGAPNYTLDPLFLTFLDQVVSWTEELELHLILDNHTFSVETATDPNVGNILEKVWPQMAQHYAYTSNRIYFEVLNEPHGIDDETWNTIQQKTVAAIREVDTKHTIIVGPANWNNFNNLQQMPVYNDDNLIYTFHFYEPFLFTHQGASWSGLSHVSDIPFPYNESKMPEYPEAYKDHWSYSSYKDYKNTGTVEEVQNLMDKAVAFQQERNVPIWCGEFGVYDINSPDEDRTFWFEVVGSYLTEKNIAWTTWDYRGAFGIFEKGSTGMFNHDLHVGVCEALGLTPPEQTEFIAMPDSIGFEIFSDFPGADIDQTSNTSGSASFYSSNETNNGNFCIEWFNPKQYDNIAFNFRPTKDLSKLVENNYALDFFIRGTDPSGSLDIRFVDTDTGEDDHPWRCRVVIDQNMVDWTGSWEHLHIPLSSFQEQGAWEDTWHNPEGKFNWSLIDKIEIVAESKAMPNQAIWFDNIYITDLDTAKVNNYNIPTVEIPKEIEEDKTGMIIYDEQTNDAMSTSQDIAGSVSFKSTEQPANGKQCIKWSNEVQYKSVNFKFNEIRNFTYLAENNYAIDLFVRSEIPNLSFDIRLVDSKEDEADHPWRMGITINDQIAEWNNKWQHIHIPLKSLQEKGSWDDKWYDPNNLFDWKAVSQFQIATEQMGFNGGALYIDDITITNKDTASVHNIQSAIFTTEGIENHTEIKYDSESKKITLQSSIDQPIRYTLYDISGRIRLQGQFTTHAQINASALNRGTFIVCTQSMKKIQNKRIFIH